MDFWGILHPVAYVSFDGLHDIAVVSWQYPEQDEILSDMVNCSKSMVCYLWSK